MKDLFELRESYRPVLKRCKLNVTNPKQNQVSFDYKKLRV